MYQNNTNLKKKQLSLFQKTELPFILNPDTGYPLNSTFKTDPSAYYLDNSPYLLKKNAVIATNWSCQLKSEYGYTNSFLPTHHKRGEIKNFSRKSSRRLKLKFAEADFSVYNTKIFFTCTYPKIFPTYKKRYLDDLKAFLQRIKNSLNPDLIIWRKELQERGAPHFHFLIFLSDKTTVPGTKRLNETLRTAWSNTTSDINAFAYTIGCDFRLINNLDRLYKYLSKYVAKVDETKPSMPLGRIWSVIGNYPVQTPEEILLTEKQMDLLIEQIKNDIRLRNDGTDFYLYYLTWFQDRKLLINRKQLRIYLLFVARQTQDLELENEVRTKLH